MRTAIVFGDGSGTGVAAVTNLPVSAHRAAGLIDGLLSPAAEYVTGTTAGALSLAVSRGV